MFKEKEKTRQRKIRKERKEAMKNDNDLAEAHRKFERERKAEQRRKAKEKENSLDNSSYIDVGDNRQKRKGLALRKKFQKDQRQTIKTLQVLFFVKFC